MFAIIFAQLRRRRGRAIALLAGILVATTGFTVLTASSSAAQLQVTNTIEKNAPTAYDILVRPAGSRTPLEAERNLVTPNFLSGQFGGISMAQWHAIQAIPGIEVAAPVEMVGYIWVQVPVEVDITAAVDRTKDTQLFRVNRTWATDRGLSSIVDAIPQYVYITKRKLIVNTAREEDPPVWSDGKQRAKLDRCYPHGGVEWISNPIEIQPDGSERVLCLQHAHDETGRKASITLVRLNQDGLFETGRNEYPSRSLTVSEIWAMPLLLAGIDPESEQRLVGLEDAVVSGGLPAKPHLYDLDHMNADEWVHLPVLATTAPGFDENVAVSVDSMGVSPTADVLDPGWAPIVPIVPKVIVDAVAQRRLDRDFAANQEFLRFTRSAASASEPQTLTWVGAPILQPGPISFDSDGNKLSPHTTEPPDPERLAPGLVADDQNLIPAFTGDTSFREIKPYRLGASVRAYDHFGFLTLAGIFDPTKLAGFSRLSAVSLETYSTPQLTGADQRSRDLLGNQTLQANGNSAGYAATPPTLLTSLDALSFVQNPTPLSAVRVRVAGATGVDPLSRERIRLAAQRISDATGLDVDITIGSSPQQQTVVLAGGQHGRPILTLTEGWSRKGVGLAIVKALDRKSLLLFALILVVCFLFLTNAVTAAVRDRRREFAVLATFGWPRHRIATLIAGEVAVVGLIAAIISAILSMPIAAAAGISLGWRQSMLALPVGLGVAVLAAAVPAWRAARVGAAASLEHGVATVGVKRRLRRRRTVLGMAMGNLSRSPGRTLLGGLSLAIGIAAVTVLSAVTYTFRGAITGTLLGDAISVQVRTVDAVAVAATVLLGLIALADVLYLNVRDRAAEFAALRSTGWSESSLGWLVTWEGLGVGLTGAVVGATAGLVAAGNFAGEFTPGLGWLTAGLAVGGTLLAGVAALVPALLQSRMPVSALLAEE